MTRGRFIAFEGGEGCGKSTQARMLAEWLRERGETVVLTREPGGTPGAEAIRALLLAPPGEGWGMRSEALLFAAARSDHVARLIEPALAAGQWVICDRYLDSSRAYQGAAGGLGDDVILALHEVGSGGLQPDLVFLLHAPAAEVSQRLAQRDGDQRDAIGGRSAAFHEAVAEAFLALGERDPDRYLLIDGSAPAEIVHQEILQQLDQLQTGSDG